MSFYYKFLCDKIKAQNRRTFGQATIEYALLLVVITVMVIALLRQISNYFGAPCSENPQSVTCQLSKVISGEAFGGGAKNKFKYWRMHSKLLKIR